MAPGVFPGGFEYLQPRPIAGLRAFAFQISAQSVARLGQIADRMAVGMCGHQRRRSLPQCTGMDIDAKRFDLPFGIQFDVNPHPTPASRRTFFNRSLRAFKPAKVRGRGREFQNFQVVERCCHAGLAASPPDSCLSRTKSTSARDVALSKG